VALDAANAKAGMWRWDGGAGPGNGKGLAGVMGEG